ncbi:PTS sugar transporter subunit IIA [Youngiibacter multivorans]|uniref:PTS system D-glucosamine-specific IIA component/PTS system glucose-specific IIA component n=1 Tax=Youngiibacter multivorans TaxID=937251 RepID=A0ABS4G405_9CLOT|nr:PTS glucose transporter subunit IIA [Youngiibacter multivorans]MBP1919264.1 PTS system D-glucosamine-specific IIA component/PTS system glucose-specific IIA component [Youngiibacter multivorans]
MFGFFGKYVDIVSPFTGKTIDLSEVPDEVFSQRMAGDGIAVIPTGNVAVAPADGDITLIFQGGHSFSIKTPDKLELTVHIGIDTLIMNGEGFEVLVQQGTKVTKGTPIVRFDPAAITDAGLSLISPVLLTDPDSVRSISAYSGIDAEAGKTDILKVRLK